MNIGVSLSPSFLCGRASSVHQQNMLIHGVQHFLARLNEAGCTHIELRTIRQDTLDEETVGAVQAARRAGLSLTVHSALADETADMFFSRLQPILDVQPDLCITVHSAATRAETVRLLRRMDEYALTNHPGVRFALENNRSKKGDNIDLVECGGVNSTIEEINLPNIGACWDFGHFYWDHLTHSALLPDDMPPCPFIERAIHTHIHSVFSDTTHFPLTMGRLPLAGYIKALISAGYDGVYNFEPEPERWADSVNAAEEIVRSVEILKNVLLQEREEKQ